jgi:hypothetical protein
VKHILPTTAKNYNQPQTMDSNEHSMEISDKHSTQKKERKKRKRTKRPPCPWKGQSRPKQLVIPREEGLLISRKVPEDLMAQLEANIDGWFEKILLCYPLAESATRKIVRIDRIEKLAGLKRENVNKCKKIVQKITNSLKLETLIGPSWKNAQIDDCELIIAGKRSKISNGRTPCSIHRDGDFEEGLEYCEYLTASVLLHKLTLENGSVKFWMNSVQFPHDPKNPNRHVDKEPEDCICTWTGEKGTMRVWDARMLHQSLPNKTNETTLKFAWNILSKGYIAKVRKKQKEQEREKKQKQKEQEREKKQKVNVGKRKATNKKQELGEEDGFYKL